MDNKPLKTSEKELERKRKYYQEHKKEIIEKKHGRNQIIYENKRMREQTGDEFEKNMMRKFALMEKDKPDRCEACNILEEDLDHSLEFHHHSYTEENDYENGLYLCKPCHSLYDRKRRRNQNGTSNN